MLYPKFIPFFCVTFESPRVSKRLVKNSKIKRLLRRIEPIYQTTIFAQFFHETSNPAPLPFTNSRIDQVSRNIERLSLYFSTQNGNETSPSLFAISREKRDRTRNHNNGEKERKGWLCAGDVLITTDSLPRFIESFFFFFFFLTAHYFHQTEVAIIAWRN